MSLTGTNTTELRELIKQDIEDSRELQIQIDKIRNDLEQGNAPPEGNVLGHIESQSRKMSKELACRIEEIEDIPSKSASDREFLQALNARQVAWDRQIMQISEIADLMYEVRKGKFKGDGGRGEFLGPGQQLPKHSKARGYKKADATAASAVPRPESQTPISSPAGTSAGAQETMPKPGGSSSEEEGSNTSERGSGSLVDDPAEGAAHGYDEHKYDVYEGAEDDEYYGDEDDDEEEDYYEDEDEEDYEPDKSDWPLCYRILDIDPNTDPADMNVVCKKACQKLASQHDPARLPNDPDAPARWAAVTKARETLEDPERKAFYDMHRRNPSGLEAFDLSRLSLENK